MVVAVGRPGSLRHTVPELGAEGPEGGSQAGLEEGIGWEDKVLRC